MAKRSNNPAQPAFRRSFRGYKRKEVDEYILHTEQEYAVKEEDYKTRTTLLVQENEHAAQLIQMLREEQARLIDDNDEYKRQLKDSKSTIQTLYDRLDALGQETEELQAALHRMKKHAVGNDPDVEEWKQRALVAEETVRRMADAEMQAQNERDNTQHIRLPFGKKAHLDLTIHKKETI